MGELPGIRRITSRGEAGTRSGLAAARREGTFGRQMKTTSEITLGMGRKDHDGRPRPRLHGFHVHVSNYSLGADFFHAWPGLRRPLPLAFKPALEHSAAARTGGFESLQGGDGDVEAVAFAFQFGNNFVEVQGVFRKWTKNLAVSLTLDGVPSPVEAPSVTISEQSQSGIILHTLLSRPGRAIPGT
jgi:hypothetical protein